MDTPLLSSARALAARSDWRGVCELVNAHASRFGEHPELLVLLAEALLRTGRAAEARRLLTSATPQPAIAAGGATIRRAVNLRGAAHFELGELDAAEEAFGQAAELARNDGDDLLAAQASNNLALIANIHGQHTEALALYRLAIPAYQRLGNGVGLSQSFHNMAITYRDTAQLDAAEEHERRAADYARQVGDDRMVAIALMGRADIQLQRGDASMAEATARHAAECLARVPDPARRADALRLAAAALAAKRDMGAAIRLVDEAVSEARRCGAALIEAECLRARGEMASNAGDVAGARAFGQAALDLFTRLNAARERDLVARWLDALP